MNQVATVLVASVLALTILTVFNIGPTGFAILEHEKPTILNTWFTPNDPTYADVVKIRVKAEDHYGIRQVYAEIPYDGGTDIIELAHLEGDEEQAIYGSSFVYDSQNQIEIRVVVVNELGSFSDTLVRI